MPSRRGKILLKSYHQVVEGQQGGKIFGKVEQDLHWEKIVRSRGMPNSIMTDRDYFQIWGKLQEL
jgi:hypothetical protein